MNLYHIEFEEQYWFVEAESMQAAIIYWQTATRDELELEDGDEPDKIHVLDDKPVIRLGTFKWNNF